MSKQILTPEDREQIHDELWAFLRGKTIEGLSYWTDAGNEHTTGIDLDFSDGSRLELYALPRDWKWNQCFHLLLHGSIDNTWQVMIR
jgi:hypothetical protein